MRTCRHCDKQIEKRNVSGLCKTHLDQDPDALRRRYDALRAKWKNDPEFRRRVTRTSHIPDDKMDDYRNLTRRKRFSAAQALEMLGVC